MRTLWQDLRYAVRTLVRTPGFTAVAALSIALGIGANTAIFSLVYAVILKPLPFREPSRLIATWDTYLPLFPKLGISPPELAALQQQTDLYEQSGWYRYVPTDLNLVSPGSPAVELHATIVSTNLLTVLGVSPALGRRTQSSIVEEPLRRQSGDRGASDPSRRSGVHHCGRHAPGISIPQIHRSVAPARSPDGG